MLQWSPETGNVLVWSSYHIAVGVQARCVATWCVGVWVLETSVGVAQWDEQQWALDQQQLSVPAY